MLHRTIHALRSLSRVSLLASLALSAGCATYALAAPSEPPIAPFGPAPRQAATVCVIRPSHWSLTATYVVHDDGQLVGGLKGESYFCYFAQPGPHRIAVARGDSPMAEAAITTLHAVRGHRYWLEQRYDYTFGDQLGWIQEDRARDLIDGCTYKEIVDAPADDAVPFGIPVAPALAQAGVEPPETE
ncbi:MAG TPA: hypothetical protein VF765_31330 [Polyangiaceae bacterium]